MASLGAGGRPAGYAFAAGAEAMIPKAAAEVKCPRSSRRVIQLLKVPFVLSLSKDRPFMVRGPHHERTQQTAGDN